MDTRDFGPDAVGGPIIDSNGTGFECFAANMEFNRALHIKPGVSHPGLFKEYALAFMV